MTGADPENTGKIESGEEPFEDDSSTMSILDHLTELRKRIIYSLIAICVGFVIAWFFKTPIFRFLMLPMIDVLGEGKMQFISPTEPFLVYIKVSALAGLLAATPFWLYQVWQFIAPGLYKKERKYILGFVFFGSILFVGGAIFGYFQIIPLGLKFLINNFTDVFFEAKPTLKETFSLSTKLLLAFGVAFELPLVIFFLARTGLVSAGWLLKNFKWAVLLIFICAAMFTPPDVITQVGLGVPLSLLYLLGVLVAYLFGKKNPDTLE